MKDNTLFKFFDHMNKGDFSFVDNMTDEEVKSISPFVLLMWCNGAQSNQEIHTLMTDLYVNEYVFSLSKHPRLLLKLFVSANCGIDKARYKFKKSVTKEESSVVKMIAKHYRVGYDAAKQYKNIIPEEDIKELKDIYGEVNASS